MRNVLALAAVVLAITTACSRPNPRMQPDPGEGYVLETTGAAIGRDDLQRIEPDATVGEVATRLASQICEREARCHGSAPTPERCLNAYVPLTTLEVVTWQCSPAALRSRAKACIAALNAEPCEMDLATKPELCPTSEACPDVNASLVSPGAELAEARLAAGRSEPPSFDREAAGAALTAADVEPCRDAAGPTGTAHVSVTFAPDGGVLIAKLDRGPSGSAVDLTGTPKGQCIVERLRKVRVPLFEGDPKTIGLSVHER
jgi:hypothetical protein